MKRLIIAMYFFLNLQFSATGQTAQNQFPWKNEREKRQFFFEGTIKDLQDMGVDILKPKGFSIYVDGVFRFPEKFINVQDHYTYCFINKDSSVYIGIAVYAGSVESIAKTNANMMMIRPDWVTYDADSTWIYHTRYSSDTSCSPINFYNQAVKSISNSDDVVEYNRIEKLSLLNRFYIYKTVTYHKKNRGFISISYFGREKTCLNKNLDKLIADNRKLIRFK